MSLELELEAGVTSARLSASEGSSGNTKGRVRCGILPRHWILRVVLVLALYLVRTLPGADTPEWRRPRTTVAVFC
jgi:hypothetical protein